jgi:hypothetical protein
LNEVITKFNLEREDFDLVIISSKDNFKDKEKDSDRLNKKLAREQQRESLL